MAGIITIDSSSEDEEAMVARKKRLRKASQESASAKKKSSHSAAARCSRKRLPLMLDSSDEEEDDNHASDSINNKSRSSKREDSEEEEEEDHEAEDEEEGEAEEKASMMEEEEAEEIDNSDEERPSSRFCKTRIKPKANKTTKKETAKAAAATVAKKGTSSGSSRSKRQKTGPSLAKETQLAMNGGEVGGKGVGSILEFVQKKRMPAASATLSSTSQSSKAKGESSSSAGNKKHDEDLWIDKHKPHKAADLSIPPKKVSEVRQWLVDALAGSLARQTKLLILRGPPGVGKSTMIDVLAEELGLKILAWTESTPFLSNRHSDGGGGGLPMSSSRDSSSSFAVAGVGGGRGDYVSQAEDFGSFLRAAAYHPLEVTTVGGSFRKDLKRLSQRPTAEGSGKDKRLFVMEEVPYHENERSAAQFCRALTTLLAESIHPAVLIFTEENEDRYGAAELEKLLTKVVLQSPGVQQIHCNPVTDANMKKILNRIASAEGVRPSVEEIGSIVVSSRGDIRHAILTLQLQGRFVGGNKGRQKKTGKCSTKADLSTVVPKDDKDLYLSNFHAIGKILYAKREAVSTDASSEDAAGAARGPLIFGPEEVLSRCDMEIGSLSIVIQNHCVEHYGSVYDLAKGLSLFSDSDLLMARLYSTTFQRDQTDPLYPEEYVTSLVGRTVAETNLQPYHRPGSFRLLTTPRFYESLRARREGTRRLAHLCDDYLLDTAAAGGLPLRLTTTEMVSELVPYAKIIGSDQSQGLPRRWGEKTETGDHEEESRAASLASALSFLRLFNRRCSPLGGSDLSAVKIGAAGASDLDFEEIVDDE